MINVIFNDFSYEILPKRRELFEKYTKIIQWGRANPTRFIEDFFKIQLTDMQKYVLLSSWCPANIVWLMRRNSGKAVCLNTKTYGKINDRGVAIEEKCVGELEIGDKIYDNTGKLTEIIHLNPIVFEEVYEVEFEDGDIIECNAEHLWQVYDVEKERNRKKENQRLIVVETQDIYKNIFKKNSSSHRYFVPLTKPLQFPERKYEIEPYLFGCFISDGRKNRPTITCNKKDVDEQIRILENINENGWIFEKKEHSTCVDILIKHPLDKIGKNGKVCESEYCRRLRALGVFGNKHIPKEYKYGSVQQRLEFLQGLYDCDGSCQDRGRQVYVQKNYDIIKSIKEIFNSLGIKSTEAKRNYLDKRTNKIYSSYVLYSSAGKDKPLFKIKRKLERQQNLTREGNRKFIKDVRKTGHKAAMRCITVSNASGLFLCGNNYTVTHNSFLASPFMMARALLLPNTNTYIMAPSGGQSQETFQKMEDIAKGNIASLLGTSSVFLDECVRANTQADPFTHPKSGYTVSLYNGSTINSLNSVIKNIVGVRSSFSVYDEAGKIDRTFYALSRPFTAQDTNFMTGDGINTDIYPRQLPNKKLLLSSAEGIDSELYDQYKLAFEKMLLGDPNYFVCDISCEFSLHPFMNGKPMKPLISQDEVDNAFATNPYKAEREQIEKKYSAHLVISVCTPLNCWKFLKTIILQRRFEK